MQTLLKTDGVGFSEVNLRGSLDGAKRWVNRKDNSLLFEVIIESSRIEKEENDTTSLKDFLLNRGNGATLVIEHFINYRDIEALMNAERTAQENKKLREEIKQLKEEKKKLQTDVERKTEEILEHSEKESQKYTEKIKKLLKDREHLYEEVSDLYAEIDQLIEGITIAYGANIKAPAEKFRERLQQINTITRIIREEQEESDEEEPEVEEETPLPSREEIETIQKEEAEVLRKTLIRDEPPETEEISEPQEEEEHNDE